MNPPWPGLLFEAAKQLSCLSIRQHALDCVRMAQTANNPEARKVWSDLARTWLMFATDLEANEGLLDEWGRPKSQKHQNES
jgi:hypothetical protein